MPHPELVEFLLPCQHEGCDRLVTIRSDRANAYIDDWLDGKITCFCPLHRVAPAVE